jgi:radical SAM superfamily enzyme YgiQ (UPF0313 family)
MKALLVYPEFPPTYWSYSYALKFVRKKCALPPLGLITVASLLPSHWRPKLVDLNIEDLAEGELRKADVVMLTGMHVQRRSLHEVLKRCKRAGVPTVVGGPYATSEPHLLEDADHLVLGEAEETLRGFCDAFERGQAPRTTQNAERPDVTGTPVPRYDLLKRGSYYNMSLQYSRGCPFSCEFCDIIVVFGRKPRTKTAEQIQAELDAIYATDFRGSVFFVDDNFIGNKKAVREILPSIKDWQEDHDWPFEFYTEASLNLAEDGPLMDAMTSAGFWSVFVGIESPSTASLEETKKNQNVKAHVDIVDRVHQIHRHGLDVWGGFIVGFDSDGPDIFQQQIDFIENAAIPEAMVGLLHAIPGTPLTERLRQAGRLKVLDSMDQFGRTNIETLIPEPILLKGYRQILQTIYEPSRYLNRVLAMMHHRPRMVTHHGWLQPRKLVAGARAVLAQGVVASYRREYWSYLREICRRNPSRLAEAIMRAAAGHHFIEYTRRVVIPRLGDIAETAVSPVSAPPPAAVPD